MSSRGHVTMHRLGIPGAEPLEYALVEPVDAHTERRPGALVIALHYGWKGTIPPRHARDFLRVFAEPAFSPLGAAIVAPQCPGTSWRQPRSERAVLALRDHLVATRQVDDRQLLLTGFSLGGMGTWFLAAHHPRRFPLGVAVAAVPVVARGVEDRSGLSEFLEARARGEPPAWHDGLAQVRFLAVNSRADELIPFAPVETGVQELQANGADIELLALDDVGHYESARFAAAMAPALAWVRAAWAQARRNGPAALANE